MLESGEKFEGLRRNRRTKNSKKWGKRWIWIISILVFAGLILGGLFYYQTHYFNVHTTINGVQVGRLSPKQALNKLEASQLKNEIYVGQKLIVNGKNTEMGFTSQDLPQVENVLKKQQTLLPSFKEKNYPLVPNGRSQAQSQMLKDLLKQKVTEMNKNLKAPQDATVKLDQGKIVVTKSVMGEQYDVSRLLQNYEKQAYKSEIHLTPVYLQPVKETSSIVKNDENKIQAFLQRTINYKVQDKVYPLKVSDFVKNASISNKGQVVIHSAEAKKEIEKEIKKINDSQSTLNKPFQFKTHSGSVITVQGQTYGWALDVNKETKLLLDGFEKGQTSVTAANVYGNGWNDDAIGYKTTTNHGIGNTYAEVSIKQQRIWLYRNGKMVLTTNVVTGRTDVNQDTHPGVWYILYKRSPSILVGSEVGMTNYHVPVKYWAPFTNDGEGFHDASWRTNWSSTAYIHQGSGGCVNTPPSVMGQVYKNLDVYEPVVVY
ncbi:L,D-transpeptidase family protein [Pullulanibacillus sp. KACC 23026]|uniref:L,D-transpeptidase family protein n=1 Tax=Pullulanibacillus sp. KACC 23026 TaxID=3028315 RepID=UPI0023AF4EAA|nr:L,D-transpeptidase family protein [Pullulanibacillus sp. KACC 23026]WEG14633.1 L,D-transpeptidase family protein [Pullulanibacillus sp. KACC 23026]